jgi:hypothetical protein
MRRLGDYKDEMFDTAIFDREIERVLSGSQTENGELSDLAALVKALRAYDRHSPSDIAVDRVATEAARLAREARLALAATAGSARRAHLTLTPRIAAMALAILIVGGTAGMAVAADAAAPGDGLYWLDRAVERIGIGAGKAEERLEEANQLLAEGQIQIALEQATEALDEDDDGGAARAALATAIEDLPASENAPASPEMVAALITYVSENIGIGVGADGREFGQGVAALARGISGANSSDDPSPAPVSGLHHQNKPDGGDWAETGTDNMNENAGAREDGKGNGNNQGQGAGNENGIGDDRGNKGGNANPPGIGKSNEKGPRQESPSLTTPGRGNRP